MSYSSYSGTRSRNGAPLILAVVLGAAGLLILGLLWWIWPNAIHGIWSTIRASWIVAIPSAVLAVFSVALIAKEKMAGAIALGLLAVLYFVGSIIGVNYLQSAKLSESVVTLDESPSELSFKERAPFDVAAATSSRALGNTTGDSDGYMRALPSLGEQGKYSTAVIRRGFLQGYESVQMLDIPLFGTADSRHVSFCDFSEDRNLRFGGALPVNSLGTAIGHRVPLGTGIDPSDAMIVCEGADESIPMVYAPLTRQTGFAITNRIPAGVAIYNGKTGELTIEDNYSGDLPVYPSSVATSQRESMQASTGFTDWMFGLSGFEDTSKDGEDPNGYNRAEFGLADESSDRQFYVTPLNARGTSSSIVAVGTVDATTMERGKLNDYSVRVYPDDEIRQANSAVADTITGGVLSGYQATGLTVFEVIPSSDGNWDATVGKKQSILYRASVEPDGTVTLRDAQGKQVGAVVSAGEDGDVEELPAPEGEADAPIQDESISTMSDEELRALATQIIDELANRAAVQE